MDDLNFKTVVSAVPEVDKGLAAVDQRFAKTRSAMEKPIASTLDFDTKSLDVVERSWTKFKKTLESPLKLQVDASAIEQATKRAMGATGARPGFVPRSSSGALAFADDPIGLKSIATTRDQFEQQVRDNMAAIIRGMKRRADAENAIANRVKIEAEARSRLGLTPTDNGPAALGDINGPAVRGRFSASEAAARRRQAEFLRGNARGGDADSRALRQVGRSGANGRKTIGELIADEADAFALAAGDNGYNAQGDIGRYEASRARAGRTAAKRKGDLLKTLANTLPGLGPAGVILGGLNLVANAPENIAALRTNTQNFGVVRGGAQTVGDAIGLGGIARNLREGMETITSKGRSYFTGRDLKAEETRRFAVEDAKRALAEQLAEKRERDNQALTPVLASLLGATRSDRQATELIGVTDEFKARRIQLRQDNENKMSALDGSLQQGREARLGPDAMRALEKQVADARIAASERNSKEVAELEKQFTKRNADLMRDAQLDRIAKDSDFSQSILLAQGKTLEATIDRINDENFLSVKTAEKNFADIAEKFGKGSLDYRVAEDALANAKRQASIRSETLIPLARKQDFEESRARTLGYQSTFDSIRSADLRRRGERSGNQDLLQQAERSDILGQFKQQYETLRQITVAQNASAADKRDAESLIRDLPGQLREALNDTTLSRVTGRDLANATFARADSAVGQSGFGLAMRENFLSQGGRSDSAKTAENTAKLVSLFEQFVRKAIGGDDPVSIFFQ